MNWTAAVTAPVRRVRKAPPPVAYAKRPVPPAKVKVPILPSGVREPVKDSRRTSPLAATFRAAPSKEPSGCTRYCTSPWNGPRKVACAVLEEPPDEDVAVRLWGELVEDEVEGARVGAQDGRPEQV